MKKMNLFIEGAEKGMHIDSVIIVENGVKTDITWEEKDVKSDLLVYDPSQAFFCISNIRCVSDIKTDTSHTDMHDGIIINGIAGNTCSLEALHIIEDGIMTYSYNSIQPPF